MHTLPKAWDLVKSSVQDAISFAKDLWKINLLGAVGSYVIIPLLFLPIGLLLPSGLFSEGTTPDFSAGMLVGLVAYVLVALIVLFILALWYSNHYVLTGFRLLRKEHAPLSPKTSLQKVPGAAWVGFLQGLATLLIPTVLVAVAIGGNALLFLRQFNVTEESARAVNTGFGGVTLLLLIIGFIYTIYAAVRLQFSSVAYLNEEKRGKMALKASWELTGGRFWSIVWRGIVFFVCYAVTSMIFTIIVGIISGILGDNIVSEIVGALLHAGFAGFILAPTSIFFLLRLYQGLRVAPVEPTTTSAS